MFVNTLRKITIVCHIWYLISLHYHILLIIYNFLILALFSIFEAYFCLIYYQRTCLIIFKNVLRWKLGCFIIQILFLLHIRNFISLRNINHFFNWFCRNKSKKIYFLFIFMVIFMVIFLTLFMIETILTVWMTCVKLNWI